MIDPGADVLVQFDGVEYPGELLTAAHGGYYLCRILTDPVMDHSPGDSKVMPEQVVAVRQGHVRKANEAGRGY